ncbi:MAG TPA: hypothetical protein VFE89_06885 [Beijerinckiaceae bacterium]|jgi:hypothetical protein|nr:hypothetical protein [Beijerinckiaceae bacterium]
MTNAVTAGLGPLIHEKPRHNGLQRRRALFEVYSLLHCGVDARPKPGHDVLP